MARITIYHNRDCHRCHWFARAHRLFDWLGRVETSTADPVIGPLRMGEIAVEDHRTGLTYQGVTAVRRLAREIPAYWLFLPLLSIRPIARRIDREVRGCEDGSCAVPGVAADRA